MKDDSLSKNLRFSDSFPVLLVPRKLETAQNRKVIFIALLTV